MGNAMRKSLFVAFLTAIIVGGFALAGTLHFGTVNASTDATGIITSDTTWTKANSPYSLTGPTAVGEGVTLTIEAGATVNLNDYYIKVNGTLRARGSSTDKIYINGVSGAPPLGGLLIPFTYGITFTTVSEGYDEQTGSGCIIENAIIDSTTISVGSSTKISNNIIDGFISAGDSSIISNNIITGKIGASSSAVVSSNTITGGSSGGGITLELTENPLIFGNTISDCSGVGISAGGSATIERNLVINNNYGISVSVWATIQNNTISNSYVGLKYVSTVAFPTISYNNFEGNSYNFYSDVSKDIDVTNNWWGTTDTQAIRQSIFDFEDDFNLGTVNFVPFLTEPNPAVLSTSTLPSPPPTTTPDQTPTPTPPQEPQQTEQLEAIIGAAIVVTVLGAGLGLLVYLIKRK
jgi:parallel beta-helix repeat protein